MGVVSASALWAACGLQGRDRSRRARCAPAGTSGHPTPAGSGGMSTSGMGSTGGTATAVLDDITQMTMPESAGPLVLRRLTYREYDHMMTQLLGDTTSPASGANGWSPDEPA